MKLRCIVVDDEPVARQGMGEYVRNVDFLELVATCSEAHEAQPMVEQGGVDLILLDIQMPNITGIDWVKSMNAPPMVIFTTAYTEYALEGYALDIIDYLVKPIPFERFLKAVQKARDFHRFRAPAPAPSDFFFVKSNGKYERVFLRELLFVEAMQNYVVLHLMNQKLIVYMTLAGIEAHLPTDLFMKVHKSFLVSITHVSAIDNNDLLIGKERIPISRSLRDAVMKRILGNNLISR